MFAQKPSMLLRSLLFADLVLKQVIRSGWKWITTWSNSHKTLGPYTVNKNGRFKAYLRYYLQELARYRKPGR